MDSVLALDLKSLSFPPAEAAVLSNIQLTIRKGEFLALRGESAAGKSLLLHTMTGAAMKYEGGVLDGSVTLMGKDIMEIPLPAVCKELGFMFQEPQNQIVSVTVAEEVSFGTANLGCSRQEIAERSAEALAFTGLTGLERRKTTSLSGGQAQRLVLAGILALKTPILILDQPGAELDLKGKCELYALIKKLHVEDGVTVIMAMDHGVDIRDFADRIIEVKDGTIAKEYIPAEYIPEDKAKAPVFLPLAQERETVLAIENVSFTYQGSVTGCENISFAVNRGDFLAVMGENGSGKTTLLKLMEGLLFPEKGSVSIFGRAMTKKTAFSLRAKIGFLFQNPDFQIFANTVKEEAAFVLRNKPLTEAEKEAKVMAILTKVGLAPFAASHPQRLSRSQRQKLAAVSALIHEPEIVIADEPTSGLNDQDSRLIMDLLAAFRAKGGTVILVSHDPDLVFAYADRIVLMENHTVAACFGREAFPTAAARLQAGGDPHEAI